MSDALDPKTLTSEAQTLIASIPLHFGFSDQLKQWIAKVDAALFAAPQEKAQTESSAAVVHFRKPVKPECPNCRQEMDYNGQHRDAGDMPHVQAGYTCQPAPPPAPVAGELPEAVSNAARIMRFVASTPAVSDNDTEALLCRADALESWARSQATAQPVAVGMTPELERLLKNAEYAEVAMRTGFNPPYLLMDAELRHSIAAVRAQAASAQPKAVGVPVEAIRNTVRRVLFSANDSAQVTIDAEEIDRWLAAVEGGK